MGAKLSLEDVETPLNRVAIVTGANQGLGFEVAKLLALHGCKVVLACRSQERASKLQSTHGDIDYADSSQAIQEIKEECQAKGINDPNLRFIPLDLASLKSVSEFCTRFKETGLPLHILICNAAVFGIPQSFTEDGYETHFQVNYLSHLLMTILLMPVMMTSGKDCRVVNVSAKLHLFTSFEMDNINGEKSYARVGFYSKSKLYQLMSMFALQRRISDSDVTISSLHPGVIETNIQLSLLDNTYMGWFFYGVKQVLSLLPFKYFLYKSGIFREADAAGLSIVYLAISPHLRGAKCVYYDETVPRSTSAESRDQEKQEKLMKYSMDCIKQYIPEELIRRFRLSETDAIDRGSKS